MIKVQIAVNHISCNAIEKVPEHTDNTSCLIIFKLKVIFQRSPVGFNDASVLDMITFKAAHKSVHIFSWSSFKLLESTDFNHREFNYKNQLSKWIYEWHHQIKTTNEVKFVKIKTTAISSVNDIRVKKSGMEILIPADLEQLQLKYILTVLASI